ncbi:hypothetical protein [Haloprofundus halobius]|nr:hypothetical protein [Haloprofundus halobius]
MPQARNSGDGRNDARQSGTADNQANADEPADAHASATAERRTERPGALERMSSWFAEAALRSGLAIIGFVLLLFALGQAVGFDLLGVVADALTSQTGQWLVVALFAVFIIAASAQRGLPSR